MLRVIYIHESRVFIHNDEGNDIFEFTYDEVLLLNKFIRVDSVKGQGIGLGIMTLEKKMGFRNRYFAGDVCHPSNFQKMKMLSEFEMDSLLNSKLVLKSGAYSSIASPRHLLATGSIILVADTGVLLYADFHGNTVNVPLSHICKSIESFSHINTHEFYNLVLDGRIEQFELCNYSGHPDIICSEDCRPEIRGYVEGLASVGSVNLI